MYFTIGGRLTEGGFFRVRYTGAADRRRLPRRARSRWFASRSRFRAGAGPRSRRRGRRWARRSEASSRSSLGIPPPSSLDREQASLHSAAPRTQAWRGSTEGAHRRQRSRRYERPQCTWRASMRPRLRARSSRSRSRTRIRWSSGARRKRWCGSDSRRTSRASRRFADIYALLNSPDRHMRFAGRLALQRTPRASLDAARPERFQSTRRIEGLRGARLHGDLVNRRRSRDQASAGAAEEVGPLRRRPAEADPRRCSSPPRSCPTPRRS